MESVESAVARRIDWMAAIWAGLIAGLVFLMVEMAMLPLFLGESPWAPPRMMAAMVMGEDVLPPPATFSLGVLMVAMVVHFVLSIIYAFVLAPIVAGSGAGPAIGVGALFGLAIYVINFYGFAPLLFPWFTEARNWVTIFAHVVFGLVLAGSYKTLAVRRPRGAS
jgi:uncharacterized membrane protein YagU involved in acid resistance